MLTNQGQIERIGVWKNANNGIMSIQNQIDFEIIDLKEGAESFPPLLG